MWLLQLNYLTSECLLTRYMFLYIATIKSHNNLLIFQNMNLVLSVSPSVCRMFFVADLWIIHYISGEGKGHPLVFLPGESQGWGSLVGCRLWGRTESDTTEAT